MKLVADEGYVYRFDDTQKVSIGRHPDNLLTLTNKSASREHALISRVGERWYIEDLNSHNGTWVNDERILEPRVLQNGDIIAFADAVYSFVLEEEDEPTSQERFSEPAQYAEDYTISGLVDDLYADDYRLRFDAAHGLVDLGEVVVEPLLQVVRSYKQDTRSAAAAALALGEIGDPRAANALIETLKDDRMSSVAIEALSAIGGDAVEPLLDALDSREARIRASAARVLGKIGDERAVEPLINALYDEVISTAETAARALGQFNDERAIEPLIEMLKLDDRDHKDNWRIRIAAAHTLANYRAVEAVEALGDRLKWPEEHFAESQAMTQAILVCGPDAVEPLIRSLRKLDTQTANEPAAYAKVFTALREEAIDPLIDVLDDESVPDLARDTAAMSLRQIGVPRGIEAARAWSQRTENG